MPQVASKPPCTAAPSEVCEMPRKTYSVASPILAESLQRSCGGGGGGAALPRAMPSAWAGPARSASATANAVGAASAGVLTFMVASLANRCLANLANLPTHAMKNAGCPSCADNNVPSQQQATGNGFFFTLSCLFNGRLRRRGVPLPWAPAGRAAALLLPAVGRCAK